LLPSPFGAQDIDPGTLTSIGGKWFLKPGEKPTYDYNDAGRFVDLFSYHTQDSNKDGTDNVQVSHDDDYLIVHSQGYPNHPTAIIPNRSNPNSIRVQQFTFRYPLQPKLADNITRLPMGPIGAALNGVVFFNPFEQAGMNAVEGYTEVSLDSCCGHPQQSGVYHYHKYPSCVKSPFKDDGKQHSPIIGFAFDGFPVYGPHESAGTMAKDLVDAKALDACNGHHDDERGYHYHYHVTPGKFPYILGGYAGVVETSNNRGLRRAGYGALIDNTPKGSAEKSVITSIRPGNVACGQSHQITFELEPSQDFRTSRRKAISAWAKVTP
jgi:YHYH protein